MAYHQLVSHFLARRHPGEGQDALLRDALQRACEEFLASGLADPKFEAELTSGSDAKFWSCMSEAFIYQRLRGNAFPPRQNVGSGPDFLLEIGSNRLWIEVVCPEPIGVPANWLQFQPNIPSTFPHEAILLRWTSAIKAKVEGLLGDEEGSKVGYLGAGTVLPEDMYVIAVNGCQMRHGPFPSLHGISQFPFAAEAVFPIGPYQLQIDKNTLKTVGRGHQHRLAIKKPNDSSVPTDVFLDPRNAMVSAIWAHDFTGGSAVGHLEPSALIHNPCASNPLPRGLLAADEEYEAVPHGEDELHFQAVITHK